MTETGHRMAESPSSMLRIADADRVEGVLDRLAARIDANLDGPLAIVGIRRRGAPLAALLAARLEARSGSDISAGELELKRYGDDLTIIHETPALLGEELPRNLEDRTVVLVDDVLYTGHTLLRAAGRLAEAGATRVRAAVLCSRDANDVPVFADWVGMQLDVGPAFVIEVGVPPYEDELGVVIRRRPGPDSDRSVRTSSSPTWSKSP